MGVILISAELTRFLSPTVENGDTQEKEVDTFSPAVNLWDACLLDFFLQIGWWALKRWIPASQYPNASGAMHELSLSETSVEAVQNPTQGSPTLPACFFIGSAMLLGHALLDCLHTLPDDVESDDGCSGASEVDQPISAKAICYLLFIRALGGEGRASQPLQPVVLTVHATLEKFHLDGLFALLPVDSMLMLIDFFTDFFFRHFKLVDAVLGRRASCPRKTNLLPTHLHFERLPSSTGAEGQPWPPPLCEAVPAYLVHLYPKSFKPELTKLLSTMAAYDPALLTNPNNAGSTEPAAPQKELKSSSVHVVQEVDLSDVSMEMLEDLSQIPSENMEQAVANVVASAPNLNLTIEPSQGRQQAEDIVRQAGLELKRRRGG
ncbi:unnamed protein product [Schistocephalus solidus]|uniref:Mediator of RNA polymerase II transcription subunit 13 n=2 Tax=Schistocephalus solidus TaxID=70667 RepID=A0A183S7X6_SCHSO|nr:unnamed protein product [Schistocephalus solidus]